MDSVDVPDGIRPLLLAGRRTKSGAGQRRKVERHTCSVAGTICSRYEYTELNNRLSALRNRFLQGIF
ncbi:hypothetical protein ALIPUT_01417 [Alistipes putredinis DSM 17216]|uniref:Uncharacterized protein n=1 Tax=Alistipes putredinis DSM 17216 TaxID=445970 RepID=B0MWB0_9BACT|nr:hypothetical protein ALIPUT_01417 [Alistipes putredinis DSM 17216]